MAKKERKYFLCTGQVVGYKDLYKYPGSHIMGHLQHVVDEGASVTALVRWVKSTPADEVPPTLPEIDSDLVGDARRIKCLFPGCERRQRWEIGKAAFLQLMRRYQPEEEVRVPTGEGVK